MKQGIRETRTVDMNPRWTRNHFHHEKQHEKNYLLGNMSKFSSCFWSIKLNMHTPLVTHIAVGGFSFFSCKRVQVTTCHGYLWRTVLCDNLIFIYYGLTSCLTIFMNWCARDIIDLIKPVLCSVEEQLVLQLQFIVERSGNACQELLKYSFLDLLILVATFVNIAPYYMTIEVKLSDNR
jgi:hypothetical protein